MIKINSSKEKVKVKGCYNKAEYSKKEFSIHATGVVDTLHKLVKFAKLAILTFVEWIKSRAS